MDTAEFKRMKKCFILTEIAKSVMEIKDTNEPVFTKLSSKITFGLRIMAANKVLKSNLSSSNSVYSGMSIENSIRRNYRKNKVSSPITTVQFRL